MEAKYQEILNANKEDFADDYAYNSARSSGETIAWNPEGYRAVKQVLIQFNDEQSSQMTDLQSTLDSLNEELAKLDETEKTPAEAEEAAAEETESAATEEAQPAEDAAVEGTQAPAEETEAAGEEAEPETQPRSREEIQADIGQIGTAIEALYSELMPKAQEVVDAFNGGTDIDTLIEKYNDDPGMTTEPTASQGYAVSAGSTYWDTNFTQAAMSIPEIGQISEPTRGDYGIYIIYYMSDITPGDVALEDIRSQVEASALEDKVQATYDDQVKAWVDAASAVYHAENF